MWLLYLNSEIVVYLSSQRFQYSGERSGPKPGDTEPGRFLLRALTSYLFLRFRPERFVSEFHLQWCGASMVCQLCNFAWCALFQMLAFI